MREFRRGGWVRIEGWVGYQARMRFGSLVSTLCPFISLLPVCYQSRC
jgi:hypothetical protein